MDPSATLERLRQAYGQDDFTDLEASADDLLDWIRKGGFTSHTVSEPVLSALLLMSKGYAHSRKDGGR